jgi:hypothetical protein
MRYEKTNFTNKYGNTTTHQTKSASNKVNEFYDLSIYIKYEVSIFLKSNVLNKKDTTFLKSCLSKSIVSGRELNRIKSLITS